MIKGLFGTLGGIVSSFAHSAISKGIGVYESFTSLVDVGLDIDFDDYGLVCERFSDLDTFKSALETIASDRLIPGNLLDQRIGKSAAKYEFVVGSSYLNPEGETEDVFMTVISDKRLSQNEILDTDLIPECAEMLALGIEEMEWEIVEGSTWFPE